MKKTIISLTLSTALAITACGDFLEEYSQDKITATEVSHLDELLLGSVYLPSMEMNGPSSSYCGFLNILDDDVNTGRSDQTTGNIWDVYSAYISGKYGYFAWQLEVGKNYESGSTASDDGSWKDLYQRINIANIILDQIKDMPHDTETDNATYYRVQGEAHFLRAYFYLTLANLYGPMYAPSTCNNTLCVPLKLTPYVETIVFPRATTKEVYDQIVSDLLQAEEYLTISPQQEKHRLHRASVEAVDLLLSRVYLYMQQWDKAAQTADKVIQSPNFSIATIDQLAEGNDFLTENNQDVIFSQGCNMISGYCFKGFISDFCVTKELYDLYQDTDARKKNFFKFHLQENQEPVDSLGLANKYHRENDYRAPISDVFTLRVSEAYLNKAEACAMQTGKETDALAALNTLRKNRINGYTNQTYNGEELVKQVRNERRKELCFEGQRWFDLRRYAVNEQYPYSRTIVHVLNVPNNKGMYKISEVYQLEANDDAYTFSLPQSVLEFDQITINNPRSKRPAILKAVLKDTTEDTDQNEGGK